MILSCIYRCLLCFACTGSCTCSGSAPGYTGTSQGHFEQGSCPPGATGPQTKSFQVCRSQVGEGAPCVAPAAQVPVVLLLVQDPHRTPAPPAMRRRQGHIARAHVVRHLGVCRNLLGRPGQVLGWPCPSHVFPGPPIQGPMLTRGVGRTTRVHPSPSQICFEKLFK